MESQFWEKIRYFPLKYFYLLLLSRNVATPRIFRCSLFYSSINRLWEVKSKTKFQIFSSKREVVAYRSFQIFIVNWLANVWYFENWLLRRGGCKWRFDCIQINCLEFNSSNGSSLHKPYRAGPIGLPHLCHLFDMWNKNWNWNLFSDNGIENWLILIYLHVIR